ncbi:phosphoribosyltransferase domain-containing protein [Vibrio splendidus]|nr:phosphoribosyltransferase domain-containing protein [Vibrio splendidus]MCC4883096.1 phosphoribosyltransferase family protein [Vibrio splendidus]
MNVTLTSGNITLEQHYINENFANVEDLIAFANRKNENRGFLFVSKLLGKHIPVRPSVMERAYEVLASEISSNKPAMVVGLAETATGMGAGIAHQLTNEKVIFQHTTRCDLPGFDRLFEISEAHSHAVGHIVYAPSSQIAEEMNAAEQLVLIDDEITTGNTLRQLAKAYLEYLPRVNEINIVSLLSWLDADKFDVFVSDITSYCEDNGLTVPSIKQNCLYNGAFDFQANPEYRETLPVKAHRSESKLECAHNLGRLPVRMTHICTSKYVKQITELAKNNPNKPISIIGTGENMFIPYLVASSLEFQGYDVTIQSTTRSPILVDGDVIKNCTVIPMQDNGDYEHYIYNVNADALNVVVTETGNNEDLIRYSHIGYVI